jgi:hypothetical protein
VGGTAKPVTIASIDESSLRHPLERPMFIASVIFNFVLMGIAIALIFYEPAWVKTHPVPEQGDYLAPSFGDHRARRNTAACAEP